MVRDATVLSRTFAQKCQKCKKMGAADLVLERTCPDEHPKSEKSGFVSD